MKALAELNIDQINLIMDGLNSMKSTEAIERLMGYMEDLHCELQSDKADIEIEKIKKACPWATEEAILDYVMEEIFNEGFGIEGFKKSILG